MMPKSLCLSPLFVLAAMLVTVWLGSTARAAELIMFEQTGCEWCEIWDEEIGILYHKTDEGKRAPLRRIDIHDTVPNDIEGKILPARFTPTFVLMNNGNEVGRITGYIGEFQFWGLLSELMDKLPTQEEKGDG